MSELTLDDVRPLWQFVEEHPEFGTESQWRWRMNNRANNGLESSGALVKRGKGIWIVIPRFLSWFTEESNSAASAPK